MTNISSVELNEVRPFFSLAMKVCVCCSSGAARQVEADGLSLQRLVALDPEEQEREEAGYLQDDSAAMDRTDTDFDY